MTLFELGEEYLRQSEAMRERIAELRGKLKGLKGLELYRKRGEILRLYTIAKDLKDTGLYLKAYYEE